MAQICAQRAGLVSLAPGIAVLAASAGVYGQLFALGPGTNAYAVSADGSTVAGPSASGHFRWTRQGGVQPIPLPASATILGLSGDGSAVFGQTVPLTAFRYDGSTALYPGVIPAAISRNGLVMTGQDAQGNAVRWTLGAPSPVRLSTSTGSQVVAHAINADGSVIAGDSNGPAGNQGMLWTAGGGVSTFSAPSPYLLASVTCVSGDGLIQVGRAENASSAAAFRRGLNGVIELLPRLPGQAYARVVGMSDDGQTLAGECGGIPAIWSGQSVQTVEAYLAARGISTAAWSIWSVNDISADGKVLAGQGMFNGQLQAWVAVVPGPGAAVPLMLAGLVAGRRHRRRP